MFERELAATAAAMVAPGKSMLAIDESAGTIAVESNVESRRAGRDLLIAADGISQFINRVNLHDATNKPATKSGTPFPDAMNAGGVKAPRPLSFSYGRALQAPALKAWKGRSTSVAAAQNALFHRAKMNGAACFGRYRANMEKDTLAV